MPHHPHTSLKHTLQASPNLVPSGFPSKAASFNMAPAEDTSVGQACHLLTSTTANTLFSLKKATQLTGTLGWSALPGGCAVNHESPLLPAVGTKTFTGALKGPTPPLVMAATLTVQVALRTWTGSSARLPCWPTSSDSSFWGWRR